MFKPEFTDHDIWFLNHQARYYINSCSPKTSSLYKLIEKKITMLFSIVPENLKSKLQWSGPSKKIKQLKSKTLRNIEDNTEYIDCTFHLKGAISFSNVKFENCHFHMYRNKLLKKNTALRDISDFTFSNCKFYGRVNINFMSYDISLSDNLFEIDPIHSLEIDNVNVHVPERILLKIFNLSSLRHLTLCLKSLPAEVGQLQSLAKLKLCGSLTKLPKEIGKLQSLTHLDLNGNKITELPTEIGNLRSLKHLDLRNNSIISFPSSISQLQKLEILHLSNPFPETQVDTLKKWLPNCCVKYISYKVPVVT